MQSLKREIIRKLFHLPVFLFPLVALYSKSTAIALLIILIFGYLAVIIYEKQSAKEFPLFSGIVAVCKRDVAYDFGPIYLALGMATALYFSTPRNVFFAAYVIAICDSAASIIGMRFGKLAIPHLNKSCLGSAVFFSTCFFGALYYLPAIDSLIIAACLMIVELLSTKGLDNLTLPIASQVLLLFFPVPVFRIFPVSL